MEFFTAATEYDSTAPRCWGVVPLDCNTRQEEFTAALDPRDDEMVNVGEEAHTVAGVGPLES